MTEKLFRLQAIILGGGVIFTTYALFAQFGRFYDAYGTIFKIKDCTIPNPVLTPCLYGTLAFYAAFIWALTLLGKDDQRSEKYLKWFLLFGVVFALSVVGYEALVYYKLFGFGVSAGGPVFLCSPGVEPLKTPCFYGFLLFSASYLTASAITRLMREETI